MRPETNSNDFGVFGINWQIRIRFSSLRNFFERFEFLVCSKFNHTPCGCPCACAVACLHPHNSISNVVASVTIMYLSMFRDLESGLSKDLKDGERGLRGTNAGGRSWRH